MAVTTVGSSEAAIQEHDVAQPGGVFKAMSRRHVVNESYVQAGALRRVPAYLIDFWITNVLFVIGLIMAIGALINLAVNDAGAGLIVPGMLLMAGSPFIPAIIAASMGRTPGKMVMGIKTANLDASDVSGLKLFVRELVKYYVFVFPIMFFFVGMLLWALDGIIMLMDKNGQSLHDKIFFNTIVVSTR